MVQDEGRARPGVPYDRANNSESYRFLRHAKALDGKTKDGHHKKCYGKAAEITYADMRYLDAYVLLSGLDPAVSREMLHGGGRLACVDSRHMQSYKVLGAYVVVNLLFVRKNFQCPQRTARESSS